MRFRIRVQLDERSISKKLMVLHDGSWRKVEDLENHIKHLLDLGDMQLELYIEDFWIPSSEKIGVICSSDEVVVKGSTAAFAAKCTSPKKVSSNRKSIKKEPTNSQKTTPNDGLVNEEELSSRKQELLSKIVAFEEDEMDVTDFGAVSTVKRKRKRKHKKSSTVCFTPDIQETPPSEPVMNERKEIKRLREGHIRFDYEDMDTAVSTSQEKERREDWQENLLSLAHVRDKVVFSRQPAINGTNGGAHLQTETSPNHEEGDNPSATIKDNSRHIGNGFDTTDDVSSRVAACIPMESPKTSDLMYFKKLIMKDCIPTVSDFMLAVVEEIGEENVLTLKICEGHTELSFTAEELQESEGDSFIVKMEWSKVLEPRLVVDPSLLSKYL